MSFLMATACVYGAAGNLDPTFGAGGKVTTDFGGNEVAYAMALQSDGKIVVAGVPTLARYNTNGTLDASFGAGGKVTDFQAGAVAIQLDGKFVVGGFRLVARYNTNGTLDTGFAGGKVAVDFGVTGVAIQSDGKIVAGGRALRPDGFNGDEHFVLIRCNADGTLDTAFGTGGEVITEIGYSNAAFAVAIQFDGKILLVGDANNGPTSLDFALARYDSDGTLDATFGTGGTVTTDFVGTAVVHGTELALAVALQPDGKIVAAGYNINCDNTNINFGCFSDFALARYNSNGTLDTTFGSGGKVVTDFSGSPDGNVRHDLAYGVLVQLDGKIVAAGQAFSSSTGDDFALARYNIDGSLDTNFGIGGRITTDFSGRADSAQSAAIQRDGKIITAGFATASNSDVALARYEGLTAQDLVGVVSGQVNGLFQTGALNQGEANSLTVKLTNVLNSLSQGKPKTACNQLNAFINEVNAHVASGVLTAAQGQALLNAAAAIRQILGC